MRYTLDESGIYRPRIPVTHRSEEYHESGFRTLLSMQSQHFWYVGRHKFLLASLQRHLKKSVVCAIDLGGGVGGWIQYLLDKSTFEFQEIALGDSSNVALMEAKRILPEQVTLYHVDLMSTHWNNRWDVIFLLDVIEHCPDDVSILKQAFESLKPNGLLIVSSPALMCFWSHNDEYAQHLRRYSLADYKQLAERSGFELVDSRYFMFFLSPLYWLSRKTRLRQLSKEQLEISVRKEHEIPNPFLNNILSRICSSEASLGHYLKFPWGTSVLGVFKKP